MFLLIILLSELLYSGLLQEGRRLAHIGTRGRCGFTFDLLDLLKRSFLQGVTHVQATSTIGGSIQVLNITLLYTVCPKQLLDSRLVVVETSILLRFHINGHDALH